MDIFVQRLRQAMFLSGLRQKDICSVSTIFVRSSRPSHYPPLSVQLRGLFRISVDGRPTESSNRTMRGLFLTSSGRIPKQSSFISPII